jgi:tetratricopeptide (TPR) repeat protein/CHAT domain-containing protein
MNGTELAIQFPNSTEINVSFGGTDSGKMAFVNPLSDKDRTDIKWYVETYGAQSLADPDDAEARRIKARLPEIGKALFNAVFGKQEAYEPYLDFRNKSSANRVLTISSQDAGILALPWELLHDPKGCFLFREKPHISIRRKITGATKGRAPFVAEAKDHLHLLFVVSRPSDAEFIDPRADPQAVIDALVLHAPGRVTWEFLRPATLNALVARLDDETKPPVDILHFDGHGVFRQVSEVDIKKEPDLFGKSLQSEIQRERQVRGQAAAGKPVGVGFLVFEKDDGLKHLIPAEDLAENLYRSKVALVVLSACQTATLDAQGDPMASVAGRLTTTGIPAILAMTHAVLVPTTRILFGKFYESLARSRGIATALDDARTFLANNPEKFEVHRGKHRQKLELDDWFVPALFHGGTDSPLLTRGVAVKPAEPPIGKPKSHSTAMHNLRQPHEAGFFGRRRELWDIECWFAGQETRRISITGFGGQGKTELAQEAGRWLLRTGQFQRVVFVDYSKAQGHDAVAVAVSTISTVLDRSLVDAKAATEALQNDYIPTLIILDNLETVAADALNDLLTAAVAWSNAGDSRILLTSRQPEFSHPDYRIAGTRKHRHIPLKGLGSAANSDDALGWFGELNKLPPVASVPPPQSEELIALFDRVQFHPLSICVLAQQLKTRTAKQLGERLEQLLSQAATSAIAAEGTPPSLVASLQLSLDRLSDSERHAVRRLGVFQGGALENDLLAIMEIEASLQPAEVENRKREAYASIWPSLRRQLESAALIEAENIPGVGSPFLRFHPTLAPILWAGLEADERQVLTTAHRQWYYTLANFLYHQDPKNPHQSRAIARCELPNLLQAVDCALDAGDAKAVDFVVAVNYFLRVFGLTREAARLSGRAERVDLPPGSQAWYLAQSDRGEQLLEAGRGGDAAAVFGAILKTLGDQPSYNLATTLNRLGRCYGAGGRPDLAEAMYRPGIAVAEQLEPRDSVQQIRSTLHTDLADALRLQGKYPEARAEYNLGLEIDKKLNDPRSQGVTLGQLGTLAMLEGDLVDAVQRYQEALELFQSLDEPGMVAVAHHQLGVVFQEARQWEQAEQHYRESAKLKEQGGYFARAAKTWNQLAMLNEFAGKPEAAADWYRKAIDGLRSLGDTALLSTCLSNLAYLLRTQPGRLDEARQLAEEALALKKTLDHGAAEIWSTYNILAKIADQQLQPDRAAQYRQLARTAKRNFAGTSQEMKQFATVIAAVVAVCAGQDEPRDFVAAHVNELRKGVGDCLACADAIERILAGERDEQRLCDNAGPISSMIIETILRAIADPTTLSALMPAEGNGSST